ncbi:response regulator [Paraburkholderia sp.]|uniref:response regulator n=1 Tax=Paraburkholderia sp. TaxID=1926495 RepID=UPI0023A707D2|nr:response regulator [Paraburkholderia sp.]MDE1179849.1 response regulator [Paraburkholderia sp.]
MTTIVVVDDEALTTDVLSFLLEQEGYTVFTAQNGRKALDVIASVGPALVITDFMMPTMSGLELAQALKTHDELKSIPIILASAAQGSIARRHTDLFAAVLDKPLSPAMLIAAVKRLLDGDAGAAIGADGNLTT